jgi:hypothetical protein
MLAARWISSARNNVSNSIVKGSLFAMGCIAGVADPLATMPLPVLVSRVLVVKVNRS